MSSSQKSARCQACEKLYKAAKRLINNNIVAGIAKIGSGFLCSAAANMFGGPILAAASGTSCAAMAGKVINYIRRNGINSSANAACQSIGACP